MGDVIAEVIARKQALVGNAALVLNPLRPDGYGMGGTMDRSDDTALLIQTLQAVEAYLGRLGQVVVLPDYAQDMQRRVGHCREMITERFEQQS